MTKNRPHIVKKNIKHNGKWLRFEEVEYVDKMQNLRKWENVARTTQGGAVAIIAKIRNNILLIRQFRPPVGNYVIEFPAGLVDKNEKFEISALRELKEETGYTGKVVDVTVPAFSSPGMTDETTAIVSVDIDDSLPENKNPQPELEQTEDIEVIPIDVKKMKSFLEERSGAGDFIDAKVMSFCAGINYLS